MHCQEMEPPMHSSSQPAIADLPWKEWIIKGAATGAIATVAGAAFFETGSIAIAGMKVPGAVAIGLGAASGSVAADLAHQYVLPYIPHNEKYEKMEYAAISLAASGLGTYAAASLIGPASLVPAFAVGAGSYLAGDYSWHHFLNKAEGGLL